MHEQENWQDCNNMCAANHAYQGNKQASMHAGLRIQRMSAAPGREFGEPASYPYMTVGPCLGPHLAVLQ